MEKIAMKGVFFTWEVIGSITVIFVVVMLSFQFTSQKTSNYVDYVALRRIGSDAVCALNYIPTFQSLNSTVMDALLSSVIPESLAMQLNITVFNSSGTINDSFIVRNFTQSDYREGIWAYPLFDENKINKTVIVRYKVGVK
jgi:hypothetical protein